MKRTALPTILFAALVLSVNSALQADVVNLVQNGQFKEYTGTPDGNGYLPSAAGDSVTGWKVQREDSGSVQYGVVNSGTSAAFIPGLPRCHEELGDFFFMQTHTGVNSISQTITGLEVGKTYTVNLLYASRVKNGSAVFSCKIGDGEELINASSIAASHHYSVFRTFTATSDTADFVFSSNTTGTDYTFNLQNVVIKESGWKSFSACTDASSVIAGEKYTHAVHFQSSGATSFDTNGVTFDAINGGAKIENSYLSRPSGAANTLAPTVGFSGMMNGFWGFDKVNTAENSQTITLSGLLPGFEYETTFYSNTWDGYSRQATITVNGEDSISLCSNSFDGVADSPARAMNTFVWQGSSNSEGALSFNFSNIGLDGGYPHIHGVANRFISAPQGTLLAAAFSGTNAQLSGTTAIGTQVDTLNLISPDSNWQIRGLNNTDNEVIYATDFANRASLRLGPNTGAAVKFNGANLTESEISHLQISVDIALGTITTDNLMQYARGAGIGFFNESVGTGKQLVDRGFSGIVVTPDGGLYYYNNMTNAEGEYIATTPIDYQGGTFSPNDFNTLLLDLVLNEDGTATLKDISFGASTADYSVLLNGNTIFRTTDLFGLMASSSTAGKNAYFDNLIVTALSESGQVPEPTGWALLVLGALGLLGMRRKR